MEAHDQALPQITLHLKHAILQLLLHENCNHSAEQFTFWCCTDLAHWTDRNQSEVGRTPLPVLFFQLWQLAPQAISMKKKTKRYCQ